MTFLRMCLFVKDQKERKMKSIIFKKHTDIQSLCLFFVPVHIFCIMNVFLGPGGLSA